MRIDVHTHGMHAERGEDGDLKPPLMPIWNPGDPMDALDRSRELGIEKSVLLDPPHVAFALAESLPDYCIAAPHVDADHGSPEEIADHFSRGARGIKFIAPMRPYSDNSYFPLYAAIRDLGGTAVFHTGFLAHRMFDPGYILGREDYVDITYMRPATLDRIGRAFPDLKILMSHFGNPWWEEAWKMMKSNANIYADMSGGTAWKKSMAMWREMFAPDGVLDADTAGKLCFATDGSPFHPEGSYAGIIEFHDRLYDALKLPEELRRKIDRENAVMLFGE